MNNPIKIAAVLGSIFFLAASRPAAAQEPALTWLGHSAFEYTTREGKVILIDPWLTNPKAPKKMDLTHVEAILITHGHADHVGEAFDLAKKYNAPLVASAELATLASKHGVKAIIPVDPSGSAVVAGITVTAVEAVHSSAYTEGDTVSYAGAPLGFVLQEYGSATLYHAGDTGVFEDMGLISRLYQPQIVMLPIGGTYTMKPSEAAMAVQLMAPKTVIPMHYGTFPVLVGTPAELQEEMKKLHIRSRMQEMQPGVAVKIKDLM